MSGSLSLVPRQLAKRVAGSRSSQPKENNPRKDTDSVSSSVETGAASATRSVLPIVGAESESHSHRNITHDNPKGKGRAPSERNLNYTDTDYARLLCLALSDFSLHSDTDLRRAIGPNSCAHEVEGSGESGSYVPLNEVLQRFPLHYDVRSPTRSLMAGMVKTLRTNATELIDVRLTSAGGGGYEVRRKDWTTEYLPPGLSCSQQEWDQKTVYLERIPAEHRNVPGILQFLTNLLEGKPGSVIHPWARIQGVTLPSHHQDKLGNPPTCKDFCLVTFTEIDDAISFTTRWPWSRDGSEGVDPLNRVRDGVTQDVTNAIQFGFRALSKTDWERLRKEYLTYRQKVLDEINADEDAHAVSGKRKRTDSAPNFEIVEEDRKPVQSKPNATTLMPDAPYPYGCLLFVRNIHPETNKTTLRTLFSSAFRSEEQDGSMQCLPVGLDYVDYSKGMDSCYLRLSTPTHTDLLVEHFGKQRIIQADGMNDKGTSLDQSRPSDKAIIMEKITGKKEQVYWERVPEKVRRQAVQKVITSMDGEGLEQNVSSVPRTRRKEGRIR